MRTVHMAMSEALAEGTSAPVGRAKIDTRDALVLGGLLVFAAALDVYTAWTKPIWLDEAFSVYFARLPWAEMVRRLVHVEFTAPLHFLLLKIWIAAFGSSELSIRAPSVAFALATLVLSYVHAMDGFGRRVAFIAAAAWAVHPLSSWYAGEARSYALTGFLVIASARLFRSPGRSLGRRRSVLLASCNVLGFASHYVFVFVPLAQLGLTILFGKGTFKTRVLRGQVVFWMVVASFAPIVVRQFTSPALDWLKALPFYYRLTDTALAALWNEPGFQPAIIGRLALVVALFLACGACLRRLLRGPEGGYWLRLTLSPEAASLTAPIAANVAAVLVLAALTGGAWYTRYFVPLLPLWCVLVAAVCAGNVGVPEPARMWRGLRVVMVLAAITLCVASMFNVVLRNRRNISMTRSNAAAFDRLWSALRPGDIVVSGIDYSVVAYYWDRDVRLQGDRSAALSVFFPLGDEHVAQDVASELSPTELAEAEGRLLDLVRARRQEFPGARVWCFCQRESSTPLRRILEQRLGPPVTAPFRLQSRFDTVVLRFD